MYNYIYIYKKKKKYKITGDDSENAMITSSNSSDYPISSKTEDWFYVVYDLNNVHDAAKKTEGINSEEMDEIPGGIPNGNSIAPYKEIHEVIHQQLLWKTLTDVNRC